MYGGLQGLYAIYRVIRALGIELYGLYPVLVAFYSASFLKYR